MTATMTASQPEAVQRQRELEILLRSRYPIVYVVSWEEKRVLDAVAGIGARLGKRIYTWSCLNGMAQLGVAGHGGKRQCDTSSKDPITALRDTMEINEPALFVFKDFHPFLAANNTQIIRALREIAQEFTTSFKTIILIGPVLTLPPELEKDVTVLDFPLPGMPELDGLLASAAREICDNPGLAIDMSPEAREEVAKAAHGLTLTEAENVFAKALVMYGRLGVEQIPAILDEKRQIIRKSGLLDFIDPDVSIGDVGGLENLKDWLSKRKLAFSDKARDFGLPPPRGVLMLGVQGCGKSLCAKAVSVMWQLPLLRLDVGRIFNSLMGSSEHNIRRAIHIAESVSPCILWIDEIDKAFGGATGLSTDSGTTQRVLGSFLTWLAEKKSSVFVAATANKVANLPPELLRKGRFDEIFFVDLPDQAERETIIGIHLKRRGREAARYDIGALGRAAAGFSGAEMEQAVIAGMFDAFYENGRDVTTEDIVQAMAETVPLSRTMSEQIDRLREWCFTRARNASAARDGGNETVSRLADLPYVEGEFI